MNGYIATTLAQALDILREDSATAYYRLTRELDGMSVLIEVAQEQFELRFAADRIVFAPPSSAPDVLVRTKAATILALIDGRASMMDCILAGDLDLRADLDALPNIARASVAFAEGAIRSRGMRGLLALFRGAVTMTQPTEEDQNLRSIM